MPDSAQNKQQRTAADKERTRQQSRAVSGKEAARGVHGGGGGQRTQRSPQGGQRAQGAQRTLGAQGAQGQRQRTRPQAGRPATQRANARRGPRPGARQRGAPVRSRQGFYIWGSIALVIVVVLVLVLVNATSSPTKEVHVTPTAVPATILAEVTHAKSSVIDAVGAGKAITVSAPRALSGQKALTLHGKPEFFFEGGEYCPFCAAERWAIVNALSRFGTFTGLQTMASSNTDVDPSTQTFTFAHAKYSSPYIAATLLEVFGQKAPTGRTTINQRPTKAEQALITKYDVGTSSTTSGGTIPFIDIGNRFVVSGAQYSPNFLQGQTRAQIAADLRVPSNPVAQGILGAANYLSAAICSIDGAQPVAVCHSAGVQAAAKALGVSF